MDVFNVIQHLLGAGVISSLVSDEALYNELGIENQSLVNWKRQQSINQQNIDWQNRMNQLNIQNSWDMWNATNQYNSPAAQMQRFKDAGLNPNLIYGQSNTTNPVSIPTMATAKQESYNSQDPVGFITNFVGKIAQIPMIFQQLKNMKLQNIAQEKQNDILDNTALKERAMADYWANKGSNEGMRYAKLMWEDFIYRNAHNFAFLKDNKDEIINLWLENFKNSLKSQGLKNRVLDAQEGLYQIRKNFEQSKYDWWNGVGNFDNSLEQLENPKGMFSLEYQLKKKAFEMKKIDLDWKEMERVTQTIGPWGKFVVSLLKMVFD